MFRCYYSLSQSLGLIRRVSIIDYVLMNLYTLLDLFHKSFFN